MFFVHVVLVFLRWRYHRIKILVLVFQTGLSNLLSFGPIYSSRVGQAVPDGSLFANRLVNIFKRQWIRSILPAGPVPGKDPRFDPAMKAGRGPCVWALDVAMLHRIVMDIIKMTFIIDFCFNGMFPEPRLPHSTATLLFASRRNVGFQIADGQPLFGEFLLDP